MLPYSHPQQAQTNLVYGIGYVSQERFDYQFQQTEQCYPASPCEELVETRGSVSVNVSVKTRSSDQCDERWSAKTEE